MKRNILLYISCLIAIPTQFIFAEHEAPLKSEVLKCIDGTALMNEYTIHKIIYIGQEISKFQNGLVDKKKPNERKANHNFQGKVYTLKELVKVEQTHEEKYRQLKDRNVTQYEAELKPVKEVLAKLKEEFVAITNPFLGDARGTHQQMMELIKEFCQKRKRPDSVLLTWNKAGNEQDSFRTHVTSLKLLDTFCSDLTLFLQDLIRSCPKSFALFKEWEKKQKNQ